MARLFTISFHHNESTYNNMVTVRTTPYYLEYCINNLAPELLMQLPGNKIISPSGKSFFFPNASSQHSGSLMNTLIQAVTVHLQAVRQELG